MRIKGEIRAFMLHVLKFKGISEAKLILGLFLCSVVFSGLLLCVLCF